MTKEERQQIVEEVLFEINKNSKNINQLPTADALKDIDNIELSGGRKVSAKVLAEALVKIFIHDYIGKHFLSSENDDEANGVIHFLKDILVDGKATFGEFVDKIPNGKGTGIFPEGRLQTRILEVESMTVMDLIINEIHAMAGEWNFSDCGKILRVEVISEREGTYKLFMEKKTDADFTPFEEEDIMLSVVSNLILGGTTYYSSWFRCLAKNGTENSVTVVLFPDKEVPGGKNYPPVAGYNVTRRGNAKVPDEGKMNVRSQSWMLSSAEGRMMFLTNVFSPKIMEHNYALSLGKMPPIESLKNIGVENDMGLYAQTIVCEHFYEIDWNGDIVPRKVDRGLWSATEAVGPHPYRYVYNKKQYADGHKYTELEQHIVYWLGCKWGCIVDKTTEEPKWNAKGWVFLEGDNNYYLDFESSNNWFFNINNVNTVITAKVYHGSNDITESLFSAPGADIEWARDTGNLADDKAWQPTYENGKKYKLVLGNGDMGSGWGYDYKQVKFKCVVYIPVGEDFEKVVNYINVNK